MPFLGPRLGEANSKNLTFRALLALARSGRMPVTTRNRGQGRAGVAATASLDLGALPPDLIDAVLQRATLRSLTRLALTNQPWCELVTAHLLQESKHWAAPTALFRACASPANGLLPTCSAIHDALDACQRDECIPEALASSMRERIPSREERLTSALVTELEPALLDLLQHTEETALQLYTAVGLRLSPAVFIKVATKLWERQHKMWAAVRKQSRVIRGGIQPGTSHSWCHVVCGAVASIDRLAGMLGLAGWEIPGWDAHDVLSLWKSRPSSCTRAVCLKAVIIAIMMPTVSRPHGLYSRGIADTLDLEIAEGKISALVSTGAAAADEQAVFMQTLAHQQAALAYADEPEGYDAMPGYEPGEFHTTVAQHLSRLACDASASVPVVVELVEVLAGETEEDARNNEYEDEYGHYHREPVDHSPVILLINDWSEICVEGG